VSCTPEQIAAEMNDRPDITPDLIRAMLRGPSGDLA
jgi:hypothetical protein